MSNDRPVATRSGVQILAPQKAAAGTLSLRGASRVRRAPLIDRFGPGGGGLCGDTRAANAAPLRPSCPTVRLCPAANNARAGKLSAARTWRRRRQHRQHLDNRLLACNRGSRDLNMAPAERQRPPPKQKSEERREGRFYFPCHVARLAALVYLFANETSSARSPTAPPFRGASEGH